MALNIDWDDWFTYQTVKVVKIRDRRLGIMHLAFLGGIVLYILIGTILLQKRYLLTELPIGSIRTSLLQPAIPNPQPPYCNQTQPTYNGFENKECIYWDEVMVLYPPAALSSIFVTTRVTQSTEETANNCSLTSSTCKFNTTAEQEYYIGDVDNFTMLIDHTLTAPNLGIQFNARQLPGKLLDTKGKEISLSAPNIVGVAGQYDILTIDTIIHAAGLDSLDSVGQDNKTRSLRDDGLLLFLFITYSNTFSYNTNRYQYTYQFSLIQDTKFKIVEPIYTTDVDHRYVFDRHGIQLIIIQTGTLGKFDFQTMLLTFVSGIGLVTVATVVVDQMAIRLLPQRIRYQKLKYQESSTSKLSFDTNGPENENTPIISQQENNQKPGTYQNLV